MSGKKECKKSFVNKFCVRCGPGPSTGGEDLFSRKNGGGNFFFEKKWRQRDRELKVANVFIEKKIKTITQFYMPFLVKNKDQPS